MKALYSSFPVQLFLLHIKKNQALLLFWILLFAIVTQNFGNVLGIPFLFLDPEYQYEVGFKSFFIVGLVMATFSLAYHITCYILDGPKFPFLATLSRPFLKFCINNSLLPLAFLITYIIAIVNFQLDYEYNSLASIAVYLLGLLCGYLLMILLSLFYLRFTNQDIFKLLALNLDKKLRRISINRGNIMHRLKEGKEGKGQNITYFIDQHFRLRKVNPAQPYYYDKRTLIKVFDQNHLNLVIMELATLALIFLLGYFRDIPAFQIPTAASGFMLLSIILMFTGAISFWLRSWATTTVIALFLLFNFAARLPGLDNVFPAFGLDYDTKPAAYNLDRLEALVSNDIYEADKAATLKILRNWRAKFPEGVNPKMVFVCSSGGGQRSALWTMRSLQTADSLTNGALMKHTALMSGASGGMVGASYFRELLLRQRQGEHINVYSHEYLDRISRDNLNPIIFSLIVNDLFVKLQHFDYHGRSYIKDRGFAFEQALNFNTGDILDKPLSAYRQPEQEALIPMLLLAPNITNDGRKLYISPQYVSYMNVGDPEDRTNLLNHPVKGIDFRRFFSEQNADSLRFLSALRMSATFPYVTPNISLPSDPPMETMDAGIADNFGTEDAVHFLYTFRHWIAQNTSGVVFLNIRDSEVNKEIEKNIAPSLLQRAFTPIRNIYKNWMFIQDLENDKLLEYTNNWFPAPVEHVVLQYNPTTLFKNLEADNPAQEVKQRDREDVERASLNWRLTTREKRNIMENIMLKENQDALHRLQSLLSGSQEPLITSR